MQNLVVGDRVKYDDAFGVIKEVIEGGYLVRYNNGEEIEEMHDDLIRANPDDMCESFDVVNDSWPNIKSCKEVKEEGTLHCAAHQREDLPF